MKSSLLEYLVCPSCRSTLEIKIKSKIKNEIKEGTLSCTNCNDKFKIINGIPIKIQISKQDIDILFWKN